MNRLFASVLLLLLGLIFQAQAQSGDLSLNSSSSESSLQLRDQDFDLKGVSCAVVLFLQGKVFVRPPDQTTFHALSEDEAIIAGSALATGDDGILDFATGPGESVRMEPGTVLEVAQLAPVVPASDAPQIPPTEPAALPATVVAVHKGTIFSALGRPDGQPIDFRVRTPLGVAGARGTFFETDTSAARANVTMFHGQVSLQTYTSSEEAKIDAGSSQGFSGTRIHSALSPSTPLSADQASSQLEKAAGLLENACGYGVVRSGLGPDTLSGLEDRGYHLPPSLGERFRKASHLHFEHRPGFMARHDRDNDGSPRGAGGRHR